MKQHQETPSVSVRTWTPGSDDDRRSGLLGFVALEVDRFRLDGVTVRKTATGKLTLSFPARTDRSGRRHAFIRPLDDAARVEIEAEVLWQLGEREDFTP